jgi:hypothetical protein
VCEREREREGERERGRERERVSTKSTQQNIKQQDEFSLKYH